MPLRMQAFETGWRQACRAPCSEEKADPLLLTFDRLLCSWFWIFTHSGTETDVLEDFWRSSYFTRADIMWAGISIVSKTVFLHGEKALLDRDLAELYGSISISPGTPNPSPFCKGGIEGDFPNTARSYWELTLYGVETKQLKRVVRRHISLFLRGTPYLSGILPLYVINANLSHFHWII